MTPEDINELAIAIARMDERLKNIQQQMNADSKLLNGNGHPGLASRLQTIEDAANSWHRYIGSTLATIAFVINTVISIYAIFHR